MIIICLLSTIGYSCKKGGSTPDPVIPDTTKPTISIAKPTAGQAFAPGNTITFQATFKDNEKLGSYEIAVTKVVTAGMSLKNVPVFESWGYTKASTSFSAGVKQADINLDISIPLLNANSTAITPGDYNFKITCVDTSNNSVSNILVIKLI